MTEHASINPSILAGFNTGGERVVPASIPVASEPLRLAPDSDVQAPYGSSYNEMVGHFALIERLERTVRAHPRLQRVAAVVLRRSASPSSPASPLPPAEDVSASAMAMVTEVVINIGDPESETSKDGVADDYGPAVAKLGAFLDDQFPHTKENWKSALYLNDPFEGYLVETGDSVVRRLPFVTMIRYIRDEDRLQTLAQEYTERGLSDSQQAEVLTLIKDLALRNDEINIFMLPVPEGATEDIRRDVIRRRSENRRQLLHHARSLFEPTLHTRAVPPQPPEAFALSTAGTNPDDSDDESGVDPDFLDRPSPDSIADTPAEDSAGGGSDSGGDAEQIDDDDERARILQRFASELNIMIRDRQIQEAAFTAGGLGLGGVAALGEERDIRAITPLPSWRERLSERVYAYRKIIGASAALLLATAALYTWRDTSDDTVERALRPSASTSTTASAPPLTVPPATIPIPPTTQTLPQNGQSTNPNSTVPPITEEVEIELKISTYLAQHEPCTYPWDIVVDVALNEGLQTKVATPTILDAVAEYNLVANREGRDTIVVHPIRNGNFWLELGEKSDTATIINALRPYIADNLAALS